MAQKPNEMETSAQTLIYQKLFDELLQVGTEGQTDSTETKNTKRGIISNYRVHRGAEGWAQKSKHKKRYDLILQSIL